ncbi:MAG: hypothetical protein DHS20C12_29280 [Pseudohongiella sp.]|nr:MAG: hypothetical protein DHS20C12_29280 [Pseudohongiella sp.]
MTTKLRITGLTRLLRRLSAVLLLLATSLVNAAENSPEQLARAALDAFLVDWNRSDLAAIQEHLSFPHVTHGPGLLLIAQEEGDFQQNFAALSAQGWQRSSFDKFKVLQVSADKVNFLVDFTRYGNDGETLSKGQVFYVVSKQEDGWGMQYRSGGPRMDSLPEAVRDRAILEATSAFYDFFDAFNGQDNEALSEVNHVPQVMLIENTFIYGSDRDSLPVAVNFEQLTARESWDFSVAEDIEVIHAMPGKVVFQLEFERFNSDGDKYRRVPALWVLSRVDGAWGVQFRSLMAPTFSQ